MRLEPAVFLWRFSRKGLEFELEAPDKQQVWKIPKFSLQTTESPADKKNWVFRVRSYDSRDKYFNEASCRATASLSAID